MKLDLITRHLTKRSTLAVLCIFLFSLLLLDVFNLSLLKVRDVDNNKERTGQPYEFSASGDSTQRREHLEITFNYVPGQNTVIYVAPQTFINKEAPLNPDLCVENIRISAGDQTRDLKRGAICSETALDLKDLLVSGDNRLMLEITHTARGKLYLYPKLWGENSLSSLACVGLAGVAAWVLFAIGGAIGLDRGANMALCGAFLYHLLWLALTPNFNYAADAPGHLNRVHYMVDGWLNPSGYPDLAQRHHPATYYFLASRFFGAFSDVWLIGPVTATKLFSVMLMAIFGAYALLIIKLCSSHNKTTYYAAALLVIFWPLAVAEAVVINCDLAIYPAWAATYYYLLRWLKTQRQADLEKSLLALGVAFLLKSNAIVPAAVVAVSVVSYMYANKIHWRQLVNQRLLLVSSLCWVQVLAMLAVALLHRRATYWELFGGPSSAGAMPIGGIRYFLGFDPVAFIANPYVTFGREPSFLNYFMSTFFYQQWNHPMLLTVIPNALNLALLLLMVSLFACVLLTHRQQGGWVGMLPHLSSLALGVLGVFLYMFLLRSEHAQNIRFIYPVIIPFAILLMQSCDALYAQKRWFLYFANLALALFIVLGGITLYLSTYLVE